MNEQKEKTKQKFLCYLTCLISKRKIKGLLVIHFEESKHVRRFHFLISIGYFEINLQVELFFCVREYSFLNLFAGDFFQH